MPKRNKLTSLYLLKFLSFALLRISEDKSTAFHILSTKAVPKNMI